MMRTEVRVLSVTAAIDSKGNGMLRKAFALWLISALALTGARPLGARTLDIYFIDVEGGQSTLIVTPAGETLLIDAGFPGAGGFQAPPGDPEQARDARRIVAAAHDAGVDHVDYLLITHFHADHVGGVPELAQLIPILNFIDHGTVPAKADENVPGTLEAFNAYAKVRASGKHLEPKPGDRLPLKGIDAIVVSSAGAAITTPFVGAGQRNPTCGQSGFKAQDPNENPRSTGIRLQFGRFRFLDVGDLTGEPLFALACPNNLVGPVNAYLVAHHGGADAADPATFTAFDPTVAILNNGETKGGAAATFAALHSLKDVDVWQLHRPTAAGAGNFEADHIANLDESTAYWLKLSARSDGSFQVLNARTGRVVSYSAK